MIVLDSLSMRQGDFALHGVTLTVEAGEYAVLMGRTGVGKTSLLEAIAGLRRVAGGRLLVDGADVTRARPGERGLGYVPQDGALFPTMTVREHLAFAPRLHRWPTAQVTDRVRELASLLGITPLLERKPRGLSGGEARRVALGRALAARPRLLLLDEPLVGLDEDTRDEMVEVLRTVHARGPATVLHVTHRRAEALELATRVFLLEDGRIRLRSATASPPPERRPAP